MKLEQQVCELSLAKRLKELGVKQESLFYWKQWIPPKGHTYDEESVKWYIAIQHGSFENYERISAFTIAELSEMLPSRIIVDSANYFYGTGKSKKDDKYYPEHEVDYSSNDSCINLERDNNEANARALMLIWLIENGHVKV